MRSVSSPTTVTHLAGHSISAVIAVYNQAVGITPWAHTLYSFDVGQLQFNVVDQALFVVTIRYELLLRDKRPFYQLLLSWCRIGESSLDGSNPLLLVPRDKSQKRL